MTLLLVPSGCGYGLQFICISLGRSPPTLALGLVMWLALVKQGETWKMLARLSLLSLAALGNFETITMWYNVNKLGLAYWMMSDIWPSYPNSQPANCPTPEWDHQPLADGRCLSEPSWDHQNHPDGPRLKCLPITFWAGKMAVT